MRRITALASAVLMVGSLTACRRGRGPGGGKGRAMDQVEYVQPDSRTQTQML